MNSMKRQNDRILKDELLKSVGAQYATGDQWRNNSRKNEGMEPKQKQHPVVDETVNRSKVQCCKEQYCIGTWNVRSMNQGKLEVVKQEMTRGNTFNRNKWNLDCCDIEWFALETNRDPSVIFETALKYCFLNSFFTYEGYSIFYKGFLPTVVDTVVI